MIPAHHDTAQSAGNLYDFVRTRSVTYNIAQVRDAIVRRRGGKARLECFEIRMDIADYQQAHGTLI